MMRVGAVRVCALALCAAAGVAGLAGSAWAEPTRKVLIESDPPGAHVYLNEKEDGIACEATPCKIDAPIGDTPLIVELEGYAPSITMLSVTAGGGVFKPAKVKLVSAGGGIDARVMAGAEGAVVKIDDEDKGTAPLHLAIEPGPHHVAYVLDGKQVFEQYIEVEPGATYFEVTPRALAHAGGGGGADGHQAGGDGAGSSGGSGDVRVTVPRTGARTRRIVTGSVLFDVGFRQFSYRDGVGTANRSENEQGHLLAGPLVELYPMAAIGAEALPELALVARFEQGFNDQTVSGVGFAKPTTTYWQSFEVSVRDRWHVGSGGSGVEASAGYVQDKLQFNGQQPDIAQEPDASYQSLRLGAGGWLRVASANQLDVFAALEERLVLSSGPLGERYSSASTNGVHAAVGLRYRRGALGLRVEGAVTRYGSSFSQETANATFMASGSSDVVELVSFAAGYSY